MPYPLNNFTTTNNHTDSSEVTFSPPKSGFSMVVTNAAIYYKLAPAVSAKADAATYLAEVFAIPGRYTFDSSDFPPTEKGAKISVRSAVAGVPAQVTIT